MYRLPRSPTSDRESAEAESLFQQVLDYELNQVQAIYGLCGIALQFGRDLEALALIHRALAVVEFAGITAALPFRA